MWGIATVALVKKMAQQLTTATKRTEWLEEGLTFCDMDKECHIPRYVDWLSREQKEG